MSRGGRALDRPAAVPADGDLGDVVPLRVERPRDRPRRRKRDLVLARAAALEDRHAETAGRRHPSPVVVVGGGGGPGECWPTTMVTCEPFVADWPPAGFCCWTMFCWLASVATVCWTTWKPACWRVATACCEV